MEKGALDFVLTTMSLWAAYKTVAQVVRAKTTDGLSLSMGFLMLLTCSTWFTYGFAQHQLTQMLNNGIAISAWSIVACVAIKYDKVSVRLVLAAVGASALSIVAARTFGGVAALGALATTGAFVARIPQAITSWRNPGGLGVSVGAFACGGAQCVLWIIYGLLHGDIWVIGSSLYAGLHSAFVVVRTVRARRRIAIAAELEHYETLSSTHVVQPRRIERPVDVVAADSAIA